MGRTYTCISARIRAHLNLYVHSQCVIYVHVCTCTYFCTSTRVFLCACMHIHVYLHAFVYIYVWSEHGVEASVKENHIREWAAPLRAYLHVYVHICTSTCTVNVSYTCTFAPVRLREYMHISVYIQYTADCECVSLYM